MKKAKADASTTSTPDKSLDRDLWPDVIPSAKKKVKGENKVSLKDNPLFYTEPFADAKLGLILAKYNGYAVVHQRTIERFDKHGPIARPHVGDIVVAIDDFHVTPATTLEELVSIITIKLKNKPPVKILFLRDVVFAKHYVDEGKFDFINHANSCQPDKFTREERVLSKKRKEIHGSVDSYPNETELTSFRSAGHEKLIDNLFEDHEIGHVTLGELRETNYNDFIESFSRNRPAVKLKLVNWINTNNLRSEFLK